MVIRYNFIHNEKFKAIAGPVLLPILTRNERPPKGKELHLEQCRMTTRLVRNFSKIQEKLTFLASISKPGNDMHTAMVELLRIMGGVPLMRCIENPVSECLMNLVVPATALAYGGQIGQWTELATPLDRYGPLLGSGGQKSKERAVLKVHVHKIKLHNHPLFSEEQVAYAVLLKEYAKYTRLLNIQPYDHWNFKVVKHLDSLKKLLAEFNNDEKSVATDEFVVQIENLYYGLLHTLSQLLEFKNVLFDLSNKVYTAWQKVKSIRREKGYSNTIGVLLCRKVIGEEDDDDKKDRKRKVKSDESVSSLTSLYPPSYVLEIPKLIKDAQAIIQRTSSTSNEYEEQDSGLYNKHRQWVGNAVEKLNSQDLSVKYVFKLEARGQVTPDKEIVDAIERSRRLALQKTEFRVVIRIKNKVITRSKLGHMNVSTVDGAVVDIMQTFELRVFNQPQTISFDVVYRNNTFFDQKDNFAGSSSIEIPGKVVNATDDHKRRLLSSDCSSGYAPVARWYEFSESASVIEKKKRPFYGCTRNVSDKSPAEVDLNRISLHHSLIFAGAAVLCD